MKKVYNVADELERLIEAIEQRGQTNPETQQWSDADSVTGHGVGPEGKKKFMAQFYANLGNTVPEETTTDPVYLAKLFLKGDRLGSMYPRNWKNKSGGSDQDFNNKFNKFYQNHGMNIRNMTDEAIFGYSSGPHLAASELAKAFYPEWNPGPEYYKGGDTRGAGAGRSWAENPSLLQNITQAIQNVASGKIRF